MLFTQTAYLQTASAIREEALKRMASKDYNLALNLFNKAIELSPDSSAYYYDRANLYYVTGKANEYLADMDKSIELDPSNPYYYLDRGTLYYHSKIADKAIADFSRAYKYAVTDSMRVAALINRGSAKGMKRDFNRALDDYRIVYKMDSGNVGVINNISNCLFDMGEKEEAANFLWKALLIDSTNAWSWMNLGFRYSEMERYDSSLMFLNKAIELNPSMAFTWNNRGYVKMMNKDYKGALSDIEHSLKMDPENAYAYRNRALVNIRLNKNKAACEDIETAIKKGFVSQYGREILELKSSYCEK